MGLRSAAIVLLAFLVLEGACGPEQIVGEGMEEPRQGGETGVEQPATAPERTPRGPLEGPRPGDEVVDLCLRPSVDYDRGRIRVDWTRESYIRWSPDGSRILFNIYGLHSVDPDGVSLWEIANVPGRDPVWGWGARIWEGSMMYFDISPMASRIAYSACAYTEVAEREVKLEGLWVWDDISKTIVSEFDTGA